MKLIAYYIIRNFLSDLVAAEYDKGERLSRSRPRNRNLDPIFNSIAILKNDIELKIYFIVVLVQMKDLVYIFSISL